MTDSWPDPPPDLADGQKTLYSAQVTAEADSRKEEQASVDAAIAADRTANFAEVGKYTAAMYQLVADSVTRSRASADLVQKGSAAIATLYTGALALVFSVTDNPLPARGVIAPIFLGAAVVLSTVYVAYITGPSADQAVFPPTGGVEPAGWQRVRIFTETVNDLVSRRSGYLRASVLCLGAGLIFIIAPFVSFQHPPNPASANSSVWPDQPSGGDPDLNKILYQAQVNEAVSARAAKPKTGLQNQDVGWLIAGGVVALTIGVVARATKKDDAASRV